MTSSPLFSWLYQADPPQPRGGWRQRRAQLAAADAHDRDALPTKPSRLAIGLLQEWCDGGMASARLCRHLRNARIDGSIDKLVLNLAKGFGQNSNRCVVDLVNQLPCMQIIHRIDDSTWTHYIKPSELFGHIAAHYPRSFRLRLGADPERLAEFWGNFYTQHVSDARQQFIQEHYYLKHREPSSLHHCIPLAVFEDAGPFSKSKSATCICVSSLLGIGDEKMCKFLVATCIHEAGDDDMVWRLLLDDLENITIEHAVGEWSFVVLFTKADEQQRSLGWGLPDYGGFEPCSECLCLMAFGSAIH